MSNKRRNWDESYAALVAYKEQHGTTNVPRRYSEDTALAKWVGRQRTYERKLTAEQRRKLLDIGFQFHVKETNEDFWNRKFELLQHYQKANGHCYVPQAHPELGEWVHAQRKKYLKGQLETDRQKMLESLGFAWKVKDQTPHRSVQTDDERWAAHVQKLEDYAAKHGTCDVPMNYKDKKLANWVTNQRLMHNRGEMRTDRKQILLNMGFRFNPLEKFQELWDRQFEKYVQSLVAGIDFSKEVSSWIKNQNEILRNGDMEPIRAERLLRVGHRPNQELEPSWQARFQKLRTLASLEESEKDSELKRWTELQRVLWRTHNLSLDRQNLLLGIGFEFLGKDGSPDDAEESNLKRQWEELVSKMPPLKVPRKEDVDKCENSDHIFCV